MGVGWTENIEKGFKRKHFIINEVALSLGVMYGREEDFVVIDGTVIKLSGVNYTLN